MNILRLIMLSVVILVSFNSCNSDDDSGRQKKTILEAHRENLKSVRIDGHNLTYLDYGSTRQKTIILLHGVPTSSLLYRNIAEELSEQTTFRVIALDLLGFGDSDKPLETGAYTIESQSKRVFEFATVLGVDSFVLAVHDSGGFVGWNMILDTQATRIDGLLITDTVLEFDGFTPPTPVVPIFEGTPPREVWGTLLESEESQKKTTQLFIAGGITDKELVSEELIDAYASALTQPETYIELFESIGSHAAKTMLIKEALADFDKPVAILWGKDDPFLNAALIANRLKTNFKATTVDLKILTGVNHYLQEDAPVEYVTFVRDFLNTKFE